MPPADAGGEQRCPATIPSECILLLMYFYIMNFYILNFNHFFLFKCTLDTQNAPLYLLFDIEIYKN